MTSLAATPDRTGTSSTLTRALHYTGRSAIITAKNWSFVLFSVGMPVVLYVVFSQIFGAGNDPDAVAYRSVIMVSMAAYGSLGAALGGGAQLAVERRSGWFRQLSITALPARAFLWSKAAVIMLLVLPSIALVYASAFVISGIRLAPGQWLGSLGLLWLGLLPMTVLGIVIGLWAKAEAVQGVTTLTLLLLAMLGGLWFPAELMPPVMQTIAQALPTYWLAELGRYPILGGAFPWAGVAVLAAWSAVLTLLGALGYRRAVATSRR